MKLELASVEHVANHGNYVRTACTDVTSDEREQVRTCQAYMNNPSSRAGEKKDRVA